MDGLVDELLEGARAEMAVVDEHGGAVEAVAYMKARAGRSPTASACAAIESGEQTVVGQNRFTETEDSPLTRRRRRRHPHRRPRGRARADARPSSRWRAERDQAAVDAALAELAARRRATRTRTSCRRRSPPPRPARRPASGRGRCARSSASYRAPDRRRRGRRAARRRRRARRRCASEVDARREALGRRIKILVGKPGLDGHSQRRRADRRARPRRRHGGRLRGHPPDPGSRSPPARSRRASTSSACRSSRARTAS